MKIGTRVWSVGKILLLAGALAATFVVFAGIGMRVALRASEVQVPQLLGHSVNEASATLADAGLALRLDPIRRPDEQVPAGRVMQQDPPAGVLARRQRTIRVWVSAGPSSNTVPPLVGETERTARTRLDQEELDVAGVSEFRSRDYPTDAVIAQDPAPSSRAPRVSLLLNRGEQATTYVMPDLIGIDGDRAAEALRALGFRVSIVGTQPYPGLPPGTIVQQRPAAGFRVAAADAISLEVSQ